MEDILAKCHDIYPPYLNGTGCKGDAGVRSYSGTHDHKLADEEPTGKKLSTSQSAVRRD